MDCCGHELGPSNAVDCNLNKVNMMQVMIPCAQRSRQLTKLGLAGAAEISICSSSHRGNVGHACARICMRKKAYRVVYLPLYPPPSTRAMSATWTRVRQVGQLMRRMAGGMLEGTWPTSMALHSGHTCASDGSQIGRWVSCMPMVAWLPGWLASCHRRS